MKTAAGLLLAPLAWMANLGFNFALAPVACFGHTRAPLLLVSLTAFVLATLGAVLAWTQRHPPAPASSGASIVSSLAVAGAFISAFCALVIFAQAIPNLMLGGCE